MAVCRCIRSHAELNKIDRREFILFLSFSLSIGIFSLESHIATHIVDIGPVRMVGESL